MTSDAAADVLAGIGSDSFTVDAPWKWIRVRTTSIIGTDATVNGFIARYDGMGK